MPINVWDYLREYDELRAEILATVDRVFRSGRLILGQEGVKFEREMAAFLGVTGGVGVNSGTDAIYIALAALGVKAGDEVITVPNTAVPTVSAIRTLGATPVFVDSREHVPQVHPARLDRAHAPRQSDLPAVPLRGVRGPRAPEVGRGEGRAQEEGEVRAGAGRPLQEPPGRQRRPRL